MPYFYYDRSDFPLLLHADCFNFAKLASVENYTPSFKGWISHLCDPLPL